MKIIVSLNINNPLNQYNYFAEYINNLLNI